MSGEGRVAVVELDGCRLRTRTWGPDRPSVVMLHDGLGSVSQWRGLPERLHRRTGRSIMAYDRAGHGDSLPVPAGAWPADWLHREAETLDAVLHSVGIDRPLVVGHSDGASIALIHAAARSGTIAGVVALAPHTFVEAKCVDAIADLRDRPDGLVSALEDHHRDPAALFEAWSGVWVSPDFRDWDIRGRLGAVDVPVLVAQGERDEYGTDAMLWDTVESIGASAEAVLVEGRGHLLHHEAPGEMVDLISRFAARMWT